MNTKSTEGLSRIELAWIVILVGGGTVASYFIVDLYDTSLIKAKVVFLLLSILISVAAFYVFLSLYKVPVNSRMAGSLWGAVPWNSLQLWQLAYVGYIFMPIEVIFSGLLVSFRSDISIWKAIMTSIAVRACCLLIYFSVRVELIDFLIGKPT